MTPVENAVAQLGQALGLALALSAQGTLQLRIGKQLALNLEADGEAALYAYAVLGPCPAEAQQSTLFGEMLEGQLFGRETGEARFGLDAHRRELLLHRRLDLRQIDAMAFQAEIEHFITVAQRWIDRLAAPGEAKSIELTHDLQPSQPGEWLRG